MKFPRRQFLHLAAGAAALPVVSRVARAQTFPTRPVRIIVGFTAGGAFDITARLIGQWLSQHLSGELFKMMAAVNLVHVPYRGAPQAVTDLLSGHVQVSFDPLPAAIEFIKSGKLRALAVTTAARSEALPDIPTVGEFVPGYEASGWNGIVAPKNTPIEIIRKLNTEINAGLADPGMRAKFAELGGMVLAGSPADFGKLIADETEKWGKVIKFAGIKPE